MDQRVLIIDGHPVYVDRTIGFLQGLTFKNIHLAKTGEEGIECVKRQKPDLVILSSMLPDADSLDVCEAVRELAPAAKIIVQIGLFTEVKTVNAFNERGADAVLMRKEKDLQPLQEAITDLLSDRV